MDNIVTQVLIGSVSCDASFSYNVDSVTVYFKDTITGESSSLLWSFGDGSVSTQNNPVHKYLAQGYHTVGLNTYNSLSGCMDFSQKIILIGREGIDCRSDFMYAVDPTVARKINFTDNSKGEIKNYLWNFGELNSSPTFTPNTSHTYNKGGYYNICLTVTDTSYISNTSCKSIAIATTAANNCKADFNFNIDSVSKTAIFTDVSLGDPNKRAWDFGDNSFSTDTNPKHPYAAAGFYLVSLKISTATGCSGKAYKLLNVNKISTGLVVAFGHDKDTLNTKAGGYPVDFVGAGLGDQSRLKWIFGDGSVDTTSTTPIHVYKKNGQYKVCYEISDPLTGDTAESCETITITSITDVSIVNNLQFSLNAFPNPFGSYTNIEYTLEKECNIELTAYDLNGRRMKTIINAIEPAGKQTLMWNTEGIPYGVYYLQLRTSDGKFTTRMVVKK